MTLPKSLVPLKTKISTLTPEELSQAIAFFKEELESRQEASLLNSFCSVCKLPQFQTASGLVCANGHGGAETEVLERPKLTNDQADAWQKIQDWLALSAEDAPIFLLKGFAGTGKSFLMQMLPGLNHNFVFSAPTNKASDVLGKFMGFGVKTTYSILGLRMTAEDDQLVLSQSAELPNLGNDPILVIDEAGMIPTFMVKMLKRACRENGWRIIFVGDPAQLTPVGEKRSPVWSTVKNPDYKAMLREVRRFDNQLLKLATHLRECVIDPDIRVRIRDDNDGVQGVFVVKEKAWLAGIKAKELADWSASKIVVWRNRTATAYNKIVRKALGFKNEYDIGEVILLASPMFSDGTMIAHTDEELTITAIDERVFNYPEMEIVANVFAVKDRSFSVYAPKDPAKLEELLNKRAAVASRETGYARKKAWALFWEIRYQFTPVRYGYALTAHRMQGTTVTEVYVDQRDILTNRDVQEANRALYVGATRATTSLWTF